MAVSRFLNVDWSQPISSFVPLPFEAAYAAGEKIQKNFDDKLAKLNESTDPFAKLNLTGSLKVYDPKSPGGIADYDLGSALENKKNEFVNSLAKEREQITTDFYDHKIDSDEFNKRVAKHITKSKTAYNILSSEAAAMEKIRKHNEEIVAKSKEFGTNPYYGTNLLEYNTDFVNKANTAGGLNDYVGVNIAEKFESEKDLNEHAKGFEESGGGGAYSTGQYIKEYQTKGVTGTRVYDYAKNIWNDSTRRIYADLQVRDYLNRTGKRPDELVDHTTYQKVKDKNGNLVEKEVKIKVPLYDAMMDEQFKEFHNALADKVVHQVSTQHMKGDPYGVVDYKKQLIDEQLVSSPADVEADASVAYDAIPDNIKGLINSKGDIDMSKFISDNKNVINWTFKDNTGKIYDLTTEGGGKIDPKSGWYWKTPANQELKNKGYKLKERPDGYIEIYDKNNNYVGKSDVNKGVTQGVVNSKLESVYKWAFDRGNKLGINPDKNESKQAYSDRVIKEVMNQSKNVSINKKIDASIAENMDKDLVGKDGSKFNVNYDDVIIPGKSGTKPVKEFLEDFNVNPASIKHASVTFDKSKPGYILFSATDKDDPNKTVEFYAKSRNLDFVNKTKDVSNFINTFKDFYKGDINSKKVNIKGEDYTVLDRKIGEDAVLALDKNRVPIVLIEKKDKGKSQFISIPINTLKNESYKRYFDSPEAKEYTRSIRESKNWMYQGLLSGDENTGE